MTTTTHYPTYSQDIQEYIQVTNSSEKVTENFRMNELFNPRNGLAKHPLSKKVVDCLQLIRDYFDVPIRVTSTYRNYIPTNGVSPASISPHMLGQAIDFQFIGTQEEVDNLYLFFKEDIENKGMLFQLLWEKGCRGFGSYDNFIHIDTVRSELYPAFSAKRKALYNGEIYAHWNKMKRLLFRKSNYIITATKEGDLITEKRESEQSNIELFFLGISGSIVGLFNEIRISEDRGKDFDGWNIAYLMVVAIFFVLIILLLFKK